MFVPLLSPIPPSELLDNEIKEPIRPSLIHALTTGYEEHFTHAIDFWPLFVAGEKDGVLLRALRARQR